MVEQLFPILTQAVVIGQQGIHIQVLAHHSIMKQVMTGCIMIMMMVRILMVGIRNGMKLIQSISVVIAR